MVRSARRPLTPLEVRSVPPDRYSLSPPTVPPRRLASRAPILIPRPDSVTQPMFAGVWTTHPTAGGRPLLGRAPETPVCSTYALCADHALIVDAPLECVTQVVPRYAESMH